MARKILGGVPVAKKKYSKSHALIRTFRVVPDTPISRESLFFSPSNLSELMVNHIKGILLENIVETIIVKK